MHEQQRSRQMDEKEETREARNRTGRRHGGRRPWPPELKLAAAKAIVEQGMTAVEVSRKLGVPLTTASQWSCAYRRGGAEALNATKVARGLMPSRRAKAKTAAIVATHESAPEAGSRRIRDLMKRFLGIGTSQTTVRRVLR